MPRTTPKSCAFRTLGPVRHGHYFDHAGPACGQPMERDAMGINRCPTHDRAPGYQPAR